MSVFVSCGLFANALSEFGCEVGTGLVGQADKYPEHVCQLFTYVVGLAFFKALVSVSARDNAS